MATLLFSSPATADTSVSVGTVRISTFLSATPSQYAIACGIKQCVAPGTTVAYGGGPLITKPVIYYVQFSTSSTGLTPSSSYWPGVFSSPQVEASEAAAVTNSVYSSWWQYEYSVPGSGLFLSAGSFGGVVRVDDKLLASAPSLGATALATAFARDIASGKVPDTSANAIYVLWLRSSQSVTVGPHASSKNSFCSYHQRAYYGTSPANIIVMPDQSANPLCDYAGTSATKLQNAVTILSHELAETITDPDGYSGWSDPTTHEELADLCVVRYPIPTVSVGGYPLQDIFSGQAHNCVGDKNPTTLTGKLSSTDTTVTATLLSRSKPLAGQTLRLVDSAGILASATTNSSGQATFPLASNAPLDNLTVYFAGNATDDGALTSVASTVPAA